MRSRSSLLLMSLAVPGVALAGYLTAAGVVQSVVGACLPLESNALASTIGDGPAPSAMASARSGGAEIILTRNPFDATYQTVSTAPIADSLPGADAPRCSMQSRVVISAVDDEHPRASLAVLGDASGKRMVHEGSALDGWIVSHVAVERVYLRGVSGQCYLDTSTTPTATASKPTVTATTASATAPPPTIPGLRRVDETHFELDRLLRDKLLESPQEGLGALRTTPEVTAGKATGMRIVGVPPASIVAALGLRAGDVVRSVNGYSVVDPEKMLEAYARLRAAPHLELALARGGRDVVFEVEVR